MIDIGERVDLGGKEGRLPYDERARTRRAKTPWMARRGRMTVLKRDMVVSFDVLISYS